MAPGINIWDKGELLGSLSIAPSKGIRDEGAPLYGLRLLLLPKLQLVLRESNGHTKRVYTM